MIQPLDEIIVRSLWDSQEELSDYIWFVSDEIHYDAHIIDIHSGYIILGYLKPRPTQYELF